MDKDESFKKGTTTLGLVCKEGVIMAADKRATMGHLIGHKNTKKLFKISDSIGLTIAGLVGDAQMLCRWLSAEVSLFELKRDHDMSVKAASTLLSNIMNGRKHMPFWVQLLVGGFDRDGGHIYSIDAAGGAIPDSYNTSGSGSPFVYGVLEDHFRENMSLEDGAMLAVRAMNAAMKRDSASGDGISICTIDSNGYRNFEDDEIKAIQTKLAA